MVSKSRTKKSGIVEREREREGGGALTFFLPSENVAGGGSESVAYRFLLLMNSS